MTSRPWSEIDRTGGALDDILRSVRARFPAASVRGVDVQIDTGVDGAAPFIVEGTDPYSRLDTNNVAAAAERINRLLDSGADRSKCDAE